MIRPVRGVAFGAAVLLMAASSAIAQETKNDLLPAFREKALVVDIVARVVEREAEELWNTTSSKVTIPGRPVSLRLAGANVAVAVQFTPYRSADGKTVLVAQGQVWVTTKDEGVRYQTTIQTIPIEFGERVYFFPLGPRRPDGSARIEIQVELKPLEQEKAEGPSAEDGPESPSPAPSAPGATPAQPKDNPGR